jgi:putative FmdB family regulatory protein
MPTYEYACKSCGEHTEVHQKFTDDPLTECPSCAGPLRKVFGNVGIAFKGSGFYKTDSRGTKSSSSSSSGDSATKADAPATKSESSTSSDSSSTKSDSGSSSTSSTAAAS